jgi:hypothetical protein
MNLASINSPQNGQARFNVNELSSTPTSSQQGGKTDSSTSSADGALDSAQLTGGTNAVSSQGTAFNLQSALSQGNTAQVASYLQSNPQERSQVYDQLLKTDMGMIYHLDQLSSANTPKTVNDASLKSADSGTATGDTAKAASAKTPSKATNDAATDSYLTSQTFKSLSSAEQSKVKKQVSELTQVGDYKKATGDEKAFMRESVARGAILAARPNNPDAQTAVSEVLQNKEITAPMLRDKQGFATQFLKATGSSLNKAVDTYLSSRPQDAVVKGISLINKSDFSKTSEGQRTLLKAVVLDSTDRIKISDTFPASKTGEWNPGQGTITINKNITNSAEQVALTLTHEATHAIDHDDYPVQVPNLDSEMRSFRAENAVYKQLSRPTNEGGTGFKSVEYETRNGWLNRGDAFLRGAIRDGYQAAGAPVAEHRNSKPVPASPRTLD